MTPQGLKAAASLHWFHWLVVSLSLLLTLAAWYISKTQTEEKLQQRFEFQSQQLLDLISERMSRYEDALRSGVAMIGSLDQGLDVNKWKSFADELHIDQRYPGINGIGPKRAEQLIGEYGDAMTIYDNIPIAGKYKYIQELNANAELLLTNYELMDLVTYCDDAIGADNVSDIQRRMTNAD
mgnify:CR=1 FL=1